MYNKHSITIITALFFLGTLSLSLRYALKSEESVPVGDSLWQITISATVKASPDRSDLNMAIPQDSANMRITSVSLDHPDFNLRRVTQKRKNQREIVATPMGKNDATFTAEYKVHVSNTKRWKTLFEKPVILNQESHIRYLLMPGGISEDDPELISILSKLREKSENEDQLVENIYSYVSKNIISDPTLTYENIGRILKRHRASNLGKAYLMVTLCRASNIPARVVTGIRVNEMIDIDQHNWVEVYQNKQWIPYDPTMGLAKDLLPNYLKINVDSEFIATTSEGIPLDVAIDSILLPTPAGLLGTGEKRVIDIFDLNRLPLNTQFLMATLLLLPLGALITTVFRQMIGVLTYGTFTPSLLAMATIHAEWFTVVVVVLIVIAVGFGSRSALPSKISRVPRLSIILTIVAIGMVFSISFMDYFQLNPNPAVILLPIIVLTGMVDRFYATTDENGLLAAVYRLVWTFIVTAVCFSIFIIEKMQHLVLSYPEIHFITLGLILLISEYKGRKLCSLSFCHWLREPKSGKEHKKESTEDKMD